MDGLGCVELVSEQPRVCTHGERVSGLYGWRVALSAAVSVRPRGGYFRLIPNVAPGNTATPADGIGCDPRNPLRHARPPSPSHSSGYRSSVRNQSASVLRS